MYFKKKNQNQLHKSFSGNKKKCENKNLSLFIRLIRLGQEGKTK